MARSLSLSLSLSLSQASRLGALVSEAYSLFPLHRRGYAIASEVSSSSSSSARGVLGKIGCMEEKEVTRDWAPDPVTGYYRPINHSPQIDPVELRNMLLNHKLRSSSQY